MGTVEYVDRLIWSLEKGGALTGSSLGSAHIEPSNPRIGTGVDSNHQRSDEQKEKNRIRNRERYWIKKREQEPGQVHKRRIAKRKADADAKRKSKSSEHRRRSKTYLERKRIQEEQDRNRAYMESRFPAWEKSMLASRGLWLTGFLTDDGKSLLLYRPDPDDSMMGLYIRVQGYWADAGMYRGGSPYLDGVQFEVFWGRAFPSTGKAQSFVLKRAMGESQ